MKPTDLGFPPKFADWRKGQLDVTIAAAASDKRVYMLSMPTGGGKSAVYMGVAKMLDARTLVLTSTKGLQAQLTADFKSMGLFEIKGQNNYRCLADSAAYTTCDDGVCHSGVECSLKADGCTYYDAVRAASKASLVVTNYAYWMTMNRYSDPDSIGKFDLLVLDEAHDAPEQLADFCAIEVEKAEVHSLLELDLPPIDEGQEVWSEWAAKARAICAIRYSAARLRIREGAKYVKQVKRLIDLGRRLAELAKSHRWRRGEPTAPDVWMPGQQSDWVAEWVFDSNRHVKGVKFSPVWAHGYAEEFLFKAIPRILMVSATLQRAAARYLGIPPDQYEFAETTSTFDPARRPLFWIPTVRVGRNITPGEQRVWLNRIDAIIDRRLDRKGIIHTRSYDRAQAILQSSRHRAIMLGHGSRNARDVVAQFKRAKPPVILISPSMETGWDFPYDQCEFQIIAKVPFLDTRSAVLQARARSDKKYLNYMTVLSLIQQYGRGMRAEDDRCETFIVDDNIEWFWPAAKEFWPKWFKAAYRRHPGVPPAAPKLGRKA